MEDQIGQGSSGEKGEGVKAAVSDVLDAALLVHALEGMEAWEDADK